MEPKVSNLNFYYYRDYKTFSNMRECSFSFSSCQGCERPHLVVKASSVPQGNLRLKNYIDAEPGAEEIFAVPEDVSLSLIYNDCIIYADQNNIPDEDWIQKVIRTAGFEIDVDYLSVGANSRSADPQAIHDCSDGHRMKIDMFRKVQVSLRVCRKIEPHGKDRALYRHEKLEGWKIVYLQTLM